MNRKLPWLAALAAPVFIAFWPSKAVEKTPELYNKLEYRIPMRDGVKLFTIVYAPKDKSTPYPFLMTRTPYGVAPYGKDEFPETIGPGHEFDAETFIYVKQDVRGRYESEGDFVDVPILKDQLDGPRDTDEATDTYDTIDWLLENIPNNNGKVGMYGISYDGFYTSCALVRSHPALVAASPQAPMADLYMGDDAYHNGAFFLIANFSFYTTFPKQNNPMLPVEVKPFNYGTHNGYNFYLHMGPIANSDNEYLHHKNHYWTDCYTHTTYDDFWQPRNILAHLKNVHAAVLLVGGWFDAEDLSGTLKTFRTLNQASPGEDLHLVMGPWSHGAWENTKGEKLGDISFGAPTAAFFRKEIELPFFRQHLKQADTSPIDKAIVFETGANQWQTFTAWPPAGLSTKRLYLQAKKKLTFEPPVETEAADTYRSNPRHPVPFYAEPTLDMAKDYMLADQRFVTGRKDVLTYWSAPLAEDLTVTGAVSANLWVSTTGTDSDFDVKLIDDFPSMASETLSGYQQLVRGEPFRGKFRNSFINPQPFTPGTPQNIRFNMPDIFHRFLKGHRILLQIQSSWFPLTDRNPQTFTDIPSAAPDQFIPATETVYRSRSMPSFIEIGVLTH